MTDLAWTEFHFDTLIYYPSLEKDHHQITCFKQAMERYTRFSIPLLVIHTVYYLLDKSVYIHVIKCYDSSHLICPVLS